MKQARKKFTLKGQVYHVLENSANVGFQELMHKWSSKSVILNNLERLMKLV